MTKREARAWARVHDLESRVLGSAVQEMERLLDRVIETGEPVRPGLPSRDAEREWACIKTQVLDPDNQVDASMILVQRKGKPKERKYIDARLLRAPHERKWWEPVYKKDREAL